MNTQRPYFRDPGTLASERLVLRINAATEIGEFAIFRAAAEDGSVTTEVTHVFWFPDKAAKAGDVVVLYTKEGANRERSNRDGSTSHFFYWGSANQYGASLILQPSLCTSTNGDRT
jgi:hypothetical protein